MKKLTLTIAGFFSSIIFITGQEKFIETPLHVSSTAGIYSPSSLSGDYLYFVVVDGDLFTRFLMDSKTKKISSFSEKRNINASLYSGGHKILASRSSADNSMQFMEADGRFYFETVNFATKENTVEEFKFKKERFIGAAVAGDYIIAVTHPRSSQSLRFYFKKDNESPRFHDADLTSLEKTELPETDEGGSNEVDLNDAVIIDNNSINNVSALASGIKIFFENNHVIILGNQKNGLTQTFKFDIQSWTQTAEKFSFDLLDGEKHIPISNSFYWNGFLFQSAAYQKKYFLSIVEMKEKKALQTFTAIETDSINFKNSPIKQQGGGTVYSKHREFEFESTEQLLRKIRSAGTIFISVRDKNNGKLELRTGGFNKLASPIGTPMPYAYTTWDKAIFFSSLLSKDSLTHIPGVVPDNIYEQIEAYQKELNKKWFPPKWWLSSSTYTNETGFIIHCDSKNNALILYKFTD